MPRPPAGGDRVARRKPKLIVSHSDDELKVLEQQAEDMMTVALASVMETIARRVEQNARPHDRT